MLDGLPKVYISGHGLLLKMNKVKTDALWKRFDDRTHNIILVLEVNSQPKGSGFEPQFVEHIFSSEHIFTFVKMCSELKMCVHVL